MSGTAAVALGGTDPSAVGIDHHIGVDQLTGRATVAVPLHATAGRSGFTPALTLRYQSTSTPSPFGAGWALDGLLSISVSTRRCLPTYTAGQAYEFTLAGELVPALGADGSPRVDTRPRHTVRYWRGRREQAHIRVEQWIDRASGDVHWRTRDSANVLTIYGADASGRIADPADPRRVFSWLAQVQYDPAGNAIRYDYGQSTGAQRYLQGVRYGNSHPLTPDNAEPADNRWHLRLEFDYGHNTRPDPHSTFRPGFEVRTHRLCREIRQLHHFDALGIDPSLVAAYRLTYHEDAAGSTLTEIGYSGFRDGTERALPSLALHYTRPAVAETFTEPPSGAMTGAPAGLTGAYRWIDLYGEGLSGILSETGYAWYYKRNEGGGNFGEPHLITHRPAYPLGQVALVDFDADGDPNLAVLHGRQAGYYRYHRSTGQWDGFRPLPALGHLEFARSRAQWLDVDGDGRAELVISDQERITAFPALGGDGFDTPVHTALPNADAPFAEDLRTSFFFADMIGDGLAAQVLVRNGRVEYWPQLGHGRFGAPVLMAGSPVFAADDEFDAARIRLVDLDGSDTADVVYLGEHEIRWWRNLSGNALVEGGRIAATIDNVSSATIGDFLGDGTPCLVWSSPLPAQAEVLRYLQLTSGIRPHLLISADNGRGRRTELHYGTSAHYYLADRHAGRPWGTRLPNHVPVVTRLEIIDQISGTRAVSRYDYHDGIFDAEQKWLFFARVDRFDAEPDAIDTVASCTRSWYHPGTDRVVLHGDYPGPRLTPHTVAHAGSFAAGDYEQVVAILAGTLLREEIFAVGQDGQLGEHPITVEQRGYLARRLQPAGGAWDPAADQLLVERLVAVHEGDADDPRITHELLLDVTSTGTTRLACMIGYPRTGSTETPAQHDMLATAQHTTLVGFDTLDRYEPDIHIEHREFDLTGLVPGLTGLFTHSDLRAALPVAIDNPVPFDADAPAGQPAARLISWRRVYFCDDGPQDALPHGVLGAKTRPHHGEDACLTPEFATRATAGVATSAMMGAAGYTLRDGYWWRSGDTAHYTSDFDLLARSIRSDGAATSYAYDDPAFAPIGITDPLGLVTTGELDYHMLAPYRVTDPNGTVTEAAYDPLGVAVVITTHGHLGAQPYGQDPLATYAPVNAPDLATVLADPAAFVQTATRYVYYDPLAWQKSGMPPHIAEVWREDNAHDGTGAAPVPSSVAVNVVYLDGFARRLQSKLRVEPGDAVLRDAQGNLVLAPDGTPQTGPVTERWLASGHLRYTAKQEPSDTFEPFYSATPAYEPEVALATFGAMHRFAYDAVGRLIRHDAPNATFETTQFASWSITSHDANDTVLDSGYRLLRESLPVGDPERMAYERATAHANTPTVVHLDPFGDPVRKVEVAPPGQADRVENTRLSISREPVEIVDARGIVAFRDLRDMAGRVWRHESADAGTEVSLLDAFDRSVRRWDARGAQIVQSFDALDRPTFAEVDGRRVQDIQYGDAAADGALRNAIGLPVRHRDQAGTLDIERYDPSGRPVRTRRVLTDDHTSEPDWAGPVALQVESYTSERAYDALGRLRREALPDDTVRDLTYLAGGGLDRITVSTTDGRLIDAAILDGAEYNARGERAHCVLGNGVRLDYIFNPETFRTTRRLATRAGGVLSDVAYTYDPVGNVVRTLDAAQEPTAATFISGLNTSAESTFTYDAFYRLAAATGRVHQGLLQHDYIPGNGFKGTRHLSFNNGAAVERYTHIYTYDAAGNLTQMRHQSTSRNWTTDMWVSPTSNRSLPARGPSGAPVTDPESRFDAAGNTAALDHLRRVDWTYRSSLARAVLIERDGQPNDAEYYNYDGDGQRVRKVFERLVAGSVQRTEKVYLDGCEITRIHSGGGVVLHRITSHITDHAGRVALIHRWRVDTAARETDDISAVRICYQLGNHLGSAQLELDESGKVISYEEYFPYGGTAFVAGDAMRQVRMRTYRFCGKESDEATGLSYFGYRYYAPWMGRWLTPDPLGPRDHPNLYMYCHGNPVSNYDPDGLQTVTAPTETGRETVVSTPQLPPSLQIQLTPEQTELWNKRQLAVVRLPGSDAPTVLTIEKYRALVQQFTAAGINVQTNVLVPEEKGNGSGLGDAGEPAQDSGGITDVGGADDSGEAGEGDQGTGDDGTGGDRAPGERTRPPGTDEGDQGTGQKDAGKGKQEKGGKDAVAGEKKRTTATPSLTGGDWSKLADPGTVGGTAGGTLGGTLGGALGGALGGDLDGWLGGTIGGSFDASVDGGSGRRSPHVGTLPTPGNTDTAQSGQGGNAGRDGAGGGSGRGDNAAGHGHTGSRAPQPGASPGSGGTSGQAGGAGGQPAGRSGTGVSAPGGPTTMDEIAGIAGRINLESGDDPGGASGGVPGGMGWLRGTGWQALYVGLSVVSLITLFFGGGGIKAAMRGLMAGARRFGTAIAAMFTRTFWRRTWRRFARSSFTRFFLDFRTYKSISGAYWRARGGARGMELHHWLFPQRWGWVPAPIRNAGFNLLVTPGWLNNYMGRSFLAYSPRWLASRGLETSIRIAIPGSLAGSAYGGYLLGDWFYHNDPPTPPPTAAPAEPEPKLPGGP
jgi:RHS repeat-associated protein